MKAPHKRTVVVYDEASIDSTSADAHIIAHIIVYYSVQAEMYIVATTVELQPLTLVSKHTK